MLSTGAECKICQEAAQLPRLQGAHRVSRLLRRSFVDRTASPLIQSVVLTGSIESFGEGRKAEFAKKRLSCLGCKVPTE